MVKGIVEYIQDNKENMEKVVTHLTEPEVKTLIHELLNEKTLPLGFEVVMITKDIDKFNIYLKRHECEVQSGEAIMNETAIAHTKRLEEKIAELEKENKKLRFQILYGRR